MFKLKKLNASGAHHIVALMFVVVLSGIVGSYLLIKSHADSFDGQIAFISGSGSEDALYLMNADGSNMHMLYKSSAGAIQTESPSWNKEGTKLLFTQGLSSSTTTILDGIFTINANGLGLQQLTSGNYDSTPSWSPDGSKILFTRYTPVPNDSGYTNIGHVYVMNSDGTNVQQITTGTNDLSPSWSSDGTKILYHQAPAGTGPFIWVTADADGSNIQPLNLSAPATYDTVASWSPDGTHIMLIGENGDPSQRVGNNSGACNIDSYDVAAATSTQIYFYSNFDCDLGDISWAPDSQNVAFSMFPWNPTDAHGGGSSSDYEGSHLYTLSADGKNLHQLNTPGLPHTPHNPAWGAVPAPSYTATCSVTSLPTSVAAGSTITPSVVITNTGNQPITPQLVPVLNVSTGNKGSTIPLQSVTTTAIAPGASLTQALAPYKVKVISDSSAQLTVTSNAANAAGKATINCGQSFVITVSRLATCTLGDIPGSIKKGGSVNPTLTIRNTGTGGFDVNLTSNINPDHAARTDLKSVTIKNFAPGASKTYSLGKYTVPKTSKSTYAVVTARDSDAKTGFSCTKTFGIR